MKTRWMIAAAAAAISLSQTATAMPIFAPLHVYVSGTGQDIGTLSVNPPLGVSGGCNYQANWTSPFNPNDVGVCVLKEDRTAFFPSCINNSTQWIVANVRAGGLVTSCQGFNVEFGSHGRRAAVSCPVAEWL